MRQELGFSFLLVSLQEAEETVRLFRETITTQSKILSTLALYD